MASSVAFAVVGEAVFNRLRKCGRRLLGRRYDVEVFEEIRSDAQVAAAADRATSGRDAPEMLAARCAQGNIAPTSTSARSKGALRTRAKCASTASPIAPTVEARARRSLACARKGQGPKGGGRCLRHHAAGRTQQRPPTRRSPSEAASAAEGMEVEELALPQDRVSRMEK